MDVDGKRIDLQVWDTAGQELYRALVPVYVRAASCGLLLYDVTDRASFDSLSDWYRIFMDAVPASTPFYIVANKIDLADDCDLYDKEGEAFAKEHSGNFVKVSALTGDGVGALFKSIALEMSKVKVQLTIASHSAQFAETESHGCLC
jgi:small GTP-binding protein